jgi:peptidoglycan hydrolase CwlO-like protein
MESLLHRTAQQNEHLKSQIREYERQMKSLGEQKRRLKSVVDTLEDKTRSQAEVIAHLNELMVEKSDNEHGQVT